MTKREHRRTKAGVASFIAYGVLVIVAIVSPYVFSAMGIGSRLTQSLLLGGTAFVIAGSGYLIDRRRSRSRRDDP